MARETHESSPRYWTVGRHWNTEVFPDTHTHHPFAAIVPKHASVGTHAWLVSGDFALTLAMTGVLDVQ